MKKLFKFLKSVRQELSFVSWPNKDDLKEGTTVVLIMSLLVGVFLSVVDSIFSFLVQQLF